FYLSLFELVDCFEHGYERPIVRSSAKLAASDVGDASHGCFIDCVLDHVWPSEEIFSIGDQHFATDHDGVYFNFKRCSEFGSCDGINVTCRVVAIAEKDAHF